MFAYLLKSVGLTGLETLEMLAKNLGIGSALKNTHSRPWYLFGIFSVPLLFSPQQHLNWILVCCEKWIGFPLERYNPITVGYFSRF